MRAIVINPEKKSVEYKELNGLKSYYAEIGNGCTLIEGVVKFENEDWLMCDDEGLFHEHRHGLVFGVGKKENEMSQHFVLVGTCIIVGSDEEGETIDCKSTLEDIQKRVLWLDSEIVEKYKYEHS